MGRVKRLAERCRGCATISIVKDFGRGIRRRRDTLGLTLEQLAARANLTPNYIGAIENGKRDPSLSTLQALARGLSVPVGELLGDPPALSAAAMEVERLFEGLTDPPPPPWPPSPPPRRGAPGVRMPVPVEPHRPPLPPVLWKVFRSTAS
jgi:transcriptional regulator with XRE-family HTH domain